MGGPGIIVEVGEGVLSRSGVFSLPTTADDTIFSIRFKYSAVLIEHPQRFFFLARVENRTIDNIPQLCIRLSLIGAFFTRMNVRRIRLLLLR